MKIFVSKRNGEKKSGYKVIATVVLILFLACMDETSGFGSSSFNSDNSRNDILHIAKRTFSNLQCKGVYNQNMFTELDRICVDCYNMYQQTQLYSLCRSNCFGSSYFKGCVDALLLNDEESRFDEMIEVLGKK